MAFAVSMQISADQITIISIIQITISANSLDAVPVQTGRLRAADSPGSVGYQVVVQTIASTADFPELKNSSQNATALYSKLTGSLNSAIVSGSFAQTFHNESVARNVTGVQDLELSALVVQPYSVVVFPTAAPTQIPSTQSLTTQSIRTGNGKSTMNGGVIAAIVLACVVVASIFVARLYYAYREKQTHRQKINAVYAAESFAAKGDEQVVSVAGPQPLDFNSIGTAAR